MCNSLKLNKKDTKLALVRTVSLPFDVLRVMCDAACGDLCVPAAVKGGYLRRAVCIIELWPTLPRLSAAG